jgi:D-hexose-6-phosphate mutarotase
MSDSPSLDALGARFAIPGLVRFERGVNGLGSAHITAPAAEARVYLHGAHVTHHQPAGQPPLLFLSTRSRFAPGVAIRGGVPIVFPWFGARAGHPTSPDHGFARVTEWAVASVERIPDGAAITLALEASDATRALWPHEFRLSYRVQVGTALDLTLDVENRSKAAFTFEEALHTYLFVGDVREASVSGLEDASYIDKTDGMKRKTLGPGPFRPSAETDRVVPATHAACSVTDPVLGRRLIVDKRNSATTVVWNPWSHKAGRMADLGADQWRGMLCVEAANAMDDAVKLAPGEHHSMGAVIRAASR